jgi:arylsulfatase A-like enzyme
MQSSGYRTGIFGKWHLGDNYPMRACDQGFQESLVHKGGGIGQPSDPPGSGYFDPVLQHNGAQKKFSGYCTDVYFKAANDWIASAANRPFFAYLAPNAPHSPLIVGDEWADPFRKQGLPEDVAKVYGMVANIDWNLGKLQETLRGRNLERDTLVIFITDNGPTGPSPRFNAGMRSVKGTVYQGGIRVPCFMQLPGRLKPGKVDRIAAHIDIVPTILDLCGIAKPAGLELDGRSLLPLVERRSTPWPDRTLFTQWHRGDVPQPFRNSAVRTQRFKLVDGKELYDLEADPAEKNDVAAAHPDTVAKLRAGYESWFASVSAVRRYAPARIYLGTDHENPVTLTRQDWRVPSGEKSPAGWWEVDVKRAGKYRVRLSFDPLESAAAARFELNGSTKDANVAKGAEECVFEGVPFAAGPGQLRCSITRSEKVAGPKFAEVLAL